MRIAYDHHIFGLHEYSGISRYLHELASHIATETNHRVGVVAPLYVNQYLRRAPPQVRVLGVPIPKLRNTGRIRRAANNLLSGTLMRHLRPDLVHETDYSFHRSAPPPAAVVLTVHDMIHERLPHDFATGDPTAAAKKMAVQRADHVICVSENTRRDLIDLLDVPWEKTSVIHHGFSLTIQEADLAPVPPRERPFLLYVGTRLPYKNFDGLLKAYAGSRLLQRDFDIVCFGGGAFSRAEREMFGRLGVSQSHVRQLSGGDASLAALYRTARAFIYPSRYEGFGIPLLEAMAFQCPVACSNTSSLPEVAGEAAILFDPDEIDAMREGIEAVVANRELRDILMLRGSARAAQFSWHRCAQATLQVYERVAAARCS